MVERDRTWWWRLPASVLLCAALGGSLFGQQEAPPPPAAAAPAEDVPIQLPGDGDKLPSIAAMTIVEEEKGVYVAEGYVDLRYGGIRLQADWLRFDRNRNEVKAHGDVVLQQEGGTLTASRIELSLETGAGTLWDVSGFQPPQYLFTAERMERIDAEHYKIFNAMFTTCTQPVPYWSFTFKRGRIHLNHYAHLHNVAFKTAGAPIFFSPYIVWPIKGDRATGLLLPEFGTSEARGTVFHTAFFWAIRRNMDATVFYDYYSLAGDGLGLEYRVVPNDRGHLELTAYELTRDVDAEGSRRYRVSMQGKQDFADGWKLITNYNLVSDGDYYNDFERDLGLSVNTGQYSFLDVSRSWSYYTLSFRTERREQFYSGSAPLVQQRLPEVEFRARSRKLGKSPFHLSFQGSANSLERQATGLDADYRRLDVGTTVSASLAPTPWLDVTPSLTLEDTYYTQRLDALEPEGVAEDPLNRGLARFQLSVLGPKLFRVFEPTPGSGGARYKHSIEPSISYTYQPTVRDGDKVILFDEIDQRPSTLNLVTYSLTNRLFRRRPLPAPSSGSEPAGPTEYDNIEEIASLEVRQTQSFDQDLSVSSSLGRSSSRGPVQLLARYNPTRALSADLRLDYDILFNEPRTISVSGSARSSRLGHARLSYYLNRGLEDGTPDSGTLRLGGGSAFLGRRLTFEVDLAYDLSTDTLQSQRYLLGYETQCCGFQTEFLERDFSGLVAPAQEFRFSVSLKGIGTLFDLNGRIN